MRRRVGFGLTALLFAMSASAQVRVEAVPPPARINVTYTETSDEGQAMRLRDLAARFKPLADQLESLEQIDIVVVHTQRELDQRLGPDAAGARSGVSYVHGIFFLSPTAWTLNPTDEALANEMEAALVRYTALRVAGGHRLPDWLDLGLVSVLTKRPFAPATADGVARYGPLLLVQPHSDDPAVGYWAVRYLVEARGGLASLRQLLRLLAQRPDSFAENLQLVYGVPAGELERDWRRWLAQIVEAEKRKQDPSRREGPLVKDRP